MPLDRRAILSAGLVTVGLGSIAAAQTVTGPRTAPTNAPPADEPAYKPAGLDDLVPNLEIDQTETLQAAIDACASRAIPLHLPAGRFRCGEIKLRSGSRLLGAHGLTTLEFTGGAAFITAENAEDIGIEGLVIDGGMLPLDPSRASGLVTFADCKAISIRCVDVRRALLNGLALERCSGRITDSRITLASQAGVFSIDAAGLEILHNAVTDCGNNGIQVWRSKAGDDGTLVAGNRIERIAARAGGSGEYGNGVNVFRAGGVLVTGNRISDCAYSAIRGNSASNIQMTGNSCARSGEVALYAEFAFEGALIANNLVDGAATGIAVTNFNEGGRLAVVQGNLVRNLMRREHEAVDKRGDGICVEADAVVSGNTIENAASSGIVAGWGKYMRDLVVTQNLIRGAGIGIAVTADPAAGSCLISQNMISGTKNGAIRGMNGGVPMGADLADAAEQSVRLTIGGNLAV